MHIFDDRPRAGTPVMSALIQRSRQGPSDLALATDVPTPVPGPDDLLVRVTAAGVNFADVMQTRGTYGGGPGAPYTAGFEAVGEVVGAGSGVRKPPPPGTRVVGTGPGAFAQYMTMPAVSVIDVPAGWADAAALGMELNWATALAALVPLGGVGPGSVVLVHAAAGGVGQAAVTLALHYGARVIATAAPSKHGVLRALGAHEVLDSSRPDLADEITRRTGGVDLVLESVGRATFAASLAVTKPITGRIVVFGHSSGEATVSSHELTFQHPVQILGLHIGTLASSAPEMYAGLLSELSDLVSARVYLPGTPTVHPLAEGPRVLHDMEARRTQGKHALDPWA
ncbi:NADPH:quinone reductase-like Zn-dependent oxidoreductase [Nocardiopsis sp. Huas11]|uniref:zinc-binding dehydrogenase n=1 Tax=Nocardiopsis sp. Huas11 TaxID=2183912 RepID=UPI000EB272EA|nr:zinc-binding dehydrogenase [Nocardiopsis sp. Huas11]RKS10889.1 NADPH:quinone reductase-like Zn-dependent oxidoreductase [Nocardiopsis sp. Huas11]